MPVIIESFYGNFKQGAVGVREIDAKTIPAITSHPAGFIGRGNELIVGLQADRPVLQDSQSRRTRFPQ
ncbi:MAG: hypothetical protein ACI395_03765 [Candidatus Cryptobacteroides sp.]